jgi:hypothetical protein
MALSSGVLFGGTIVVVDRMKFSWLLATAAVRLPSRVPQDVRLRLVDGERDP